MLYICIEDDRLVAGAQELPENIAALSEDERRERGWRPCVDLDERKDGENALDPVYQWDATRATRYLRSEPASADQISAAKLQAWESIRTERDRRQSDGGVQVGGKWFMSNDKEAGRYNLIITASQAAGVPGTYVMRAAWRTMQDGVTQDMTANLASQIILTGLALFAAIDDAALAHKAAMEASADPLAYDFSGGWPKVFGE